jgi:hypothetical protein
VTAVFSAGRSAIKLSSIELPIARLRQAADDCMRRLWCGTVCHALLRTPVPRPGAKDLAAGRHLEFREMVDYVFPKELAGNT